jgi:hypothetical protein
MGGHVSHMGEMRNAYKVLVRKPNGKIILEQVLDTDQWQAHVNTVMNLWVP